LRETNSRSKGDCRAAGATLTAIYLFDEGAGRAGVAPHEPEVDPRRLSASRVRAAAPRTLLDVPETGSLAGDLSPFQTFMRERMSAALDEHLEALGQARSGAR
jgi:hypothetical protein